MERYEICNFVVGSLINLGWVVRILIEVERLMD